MTSSQPPGFPYYDDEKVEQQPQKKKQRLEVPKGFDEEEWKRKVARFVEFYSDENVKKRAESKRPLPPSDIFERSRDSTDKRQNSYAALMRPKKKK
jgi:hypothetical protein